jgi:hypothetical protein
MLYGFHPLMANQRSGHYVEHVEILFFWSGLFKDLMLSEFNFEGMVFP